MTTQKVSLGRAAHAAGQAKGRDKAGDADTWTDALEKQQKQIKRIGPTETLLSLQ